MDLARQPFSDSQKPIDFASSPWPLGWEPRGGETRQWSPWSRYELLAATRRFFARPSGAVADAEADFCDVHPSWHLPGCRIKWVCYRVTHNFPSEKMARPSQRACLVVTESDDVFGLECDNEVHAIAPNGYSPAKRVKGPSARVLAMH